MWEWTSNDHTKLVNLPLIDSNISFLPFFRFCDRIIGIDVSANQIAHAIPKDNIEYRCNKAEDLTFLPSDSVDLITIATAFHWLDIPAFFTEVQRVLKPNRGVLAIWTYGPGSADNPRADAVYHEFDQITLSQYWHKGKWLVDDFYRSLVPLFPYQSTLKAYTVEQRSEITIKQFVDIVETYSACQTFKKQEGEEAYKNLIETFRKKLIDCFQGEDADETRVMISNPIQLYLMKKQ